MMNGKLALESKVDQGSTFTVMLDNIQIATQDYFPLSELEEDHPPDFLPSKVLIVDDIPLNRSLIRSFFESSPLQFLEAENGLQALELAQREQPELILMDLKMPVMDGYQATLHLKNHLQTAQIPVIALTASGMKREEKSEFFQGFDGFLRKPVRKVDLLKEMALYLPIRQRDLPVPPEITVVTPLPAGSYKSVPDLLKLYDGIKDSLELDQIEEFAEQVLELGHQHQAFELTNFAQKLQLHSQRFEMDLLQNLLPHFPELISKLTTEV